MKSPRKFPVIAPKPASGRASHDGGDATVLPARPRLPPQRLQRASGSSCVACRRHKIRCDGRLPSCSPCAKRGRTCEYQASRKGDVRELEQSGRVVRLLRTLPYDQALALLSSLRSSNGSGSNQDEAAGERLLLPRPSRAPPATAAEPGLAFELLVRFPAAYPALFPLAVSDLHEAELLRPSPPFLRNADTPAGSDWPSPSSLSSPSAPTQAGTTAGHLVPNLSLLDITRWTTVEIPSATAIQAITLYLANDHPILPLFDQALFFTSLLGYQNYHCSTLLVNALLAWSCQSLSAINPQAQIFGPALLREADRLWAARAAHHNTLTSVAALQLMSMAAAAHGDEDASRRYATASCALGRLMGLFDVSSAQHSAAAWASRHEDWLRAASSTAWGTFNWTCVRALHYHHLDILTPPLLPMPGLTGNSAAGHDDVDGNDGDTADGEQSASSRRLDGSSVRASCQLFVIFHDVAKQYLGTGGPDDARRADGSRKHCPLDIGSVEIYYKKLLDWASGLPLGLVRGDHNNHQVTMLHIYLHTIITDLLGSFLMQSSADPVEQPPRLGAAEHGQRRQRLEQPHSIPRHAAAPPLCFSIFESRPAPVADARQASADQLKSLLLTYRLRHRENCVSVLWQEAAGYVLRGALQDCCVGGGGGGGGGGGSRRSSSSTTNSDSNNNDIDRKSVNNSENYNNHNIDDIDTIKDGGDHHQHSRTGATTAIGRDDGGGSGSGTYVRLGLTPVMELAQLYHAFRFVAIGAPRGGPDGDNNGLAGGSSGFRFEAATAATVPEMASTIDEASLLQVFKQEANVFGSCSASSTAVSPGIETPVASSSDSRDPRSPYH